MKPQKIEKGEKEIKVIFADEKQEKQKQRQSRLLATLADKKAKGKLTLEDIYEQNQIIIEMLLDLMPPK